MKDTQLINIGKRLRQERELHHWTQEELAEKIGGSVPSINRWEHDRTSLRSEWLALLTEAFGRPPEQWGMARQIPWNVPFLRNPYFTGREQILQRLHRALAAEQTVALSQTRAISGLGGMGKTQTAIEYAYRYAEEYEAVLWIRADSSETLMSDFAALSTILDLKLPVQQEHDQQYVVSMVKRWLEKHSPWLLIFDNVNDLALVTDMLPRRASGAILLTTRLQVTGPHFTKIELEKMSREESTTFLLRRITTDDEERLTTEISQQERVAAEQLWNVMEGLPLALDQAAAYIEETGCTISDYLELFKTHSKQLLNLRGQVAGVYPESVATTWLLTFAKVERANPVATELLRLCAFLHPDEIPESLLIAGASFPGSAFESIVADKIERDKAIGDLRKYSLVKRNAEKKILTIHRLVQAVIKDGMDEETSRVWVERAVQAINTTFPHVESGSWLQCELLLPHALLIAQYIEQYHIISEKAGNLLYNMALYLYYRARYAESESLYRKTLQMREQQFGPEHLSVAPALDGLADLYREQGKYAQAEPLHQRALQIREPWSESEYLNIAISFYNLAILYREQGRYAEAEPLHLRALALREQHLGSEHLLVAASLNGLGLLYREQGRYAEAESLYRRALAIREQQLEPEHPQIATSLNNLAILYIDQGKYAEAEPLCQRVLVVAKQTYGEEHPSFATYLNNLAVVYYEQGKYAQVVPLFQRVLHIWELHWGLEHVFVGLGCCNLAEVYTILGEYAEAELLYQRSLRIWSQQKPRHPKEVDPLDGLANLYRVQGRYSEAEPLYRRALRICEQQLGADHPQTALLLHNFARLWEAQDNFEEARTCYTRALTIREQALGTNHPKTTETRNHLVALLHTMEVHEKA